MTKTMNFISLREAIENMAQCIRGKALPLEPDHAEDYLYSDAAYVETDSYSNVAAVLHRELHNNDATRPHWVEIRETTKQPLVNDAVSIEGMGILEHMAGWNVRLRAEHIRYLTECEQAEGAGIDVSLHPPPIRLGRGQYTRSGWKRASEIGFDRAELIAFLTANEIPHSLSPPAPATVAAPPKLAVGVPWQEQARTIADELDLRDAEMGAYDSITNMADRVADEMRKRGLKGERGPVTGSTVKREALQGGKWKRLRGKNKTEETGEMGGGYKTA